mmetsp:Transcript_12932/g.29279  ORF Transcript_12932/g.29279 Transcript_12932/m.29279 type:complete len:205 (-) Transcript_12932:1606-2220(-)
MFPHLYRQSILLRHASSHLVILILLVIILILVFDGFSIFTILLSISHCRRLFCFLGFLAFCIFLSLLSFFSLFSFFSFFSFLSFLSFLGFLSFLFCSVIHEIVALGHQQASNISFCLIYFLWCASDLHRGLLRQFHLHLKVLLDLLLLSPLLAYDDTHCLLLHLQLLVDPSRMCQLMMTVDRKHLDDLECGFYILALTSNSNIH